MMRSLTILALALTSTSALAQSTIYGINLRQDNVFTTDTATFTASYTSVGPNAQSFHAMDFDAGATTLWAIENGTNNYGTIDLVTGVFTAVGVATGISGATGLTASADGATWYLSRLSGGTNRLYVGDVTTGTFTLVGVIAGGVIIDIAIDSQGNLYGHNTSADSLVRINTTTGQGTVIGATGQVAASSAQGMDFDWSTDTLYAAIYAGGSSGVFASLNLTTGAATVLDVTNALEGKMEIAVQVPSSGFIPCTRFCSSTPNSTGGAAIITTTDGCDADANGIMSLMAAPVPNQPGIFFHGTAQLSIPFGNGLLCTAGTITRGGVVVGSGNQVTYDFDYAGAGVSAGIGNFQYWFRDPAGGGAFFDTSDGIQNQW